MKNNKMMYQELAQDKIEPLKAALGAKTSKALVIFYNTINLNIRKKKSMTWLLIVRSTWKKLLQDT